MFRILLFTAFAAFLSSQPLYAEEKMLEDVIAEVNPSVVGIVADTSENMQSVGTGIIISTDGYVVTNAHVTENAKKITLFTSDNEELSAQLIGADSKTDIALLKIENPINLVMSSFADSEQTRVGNRVFAIGNPFGLGNSVSAGIISAKERDIEKGPYDNFLQTDTVINQGNSGGPLFNMNGEIIGINTAIFSTDGNSSGIAFATPSNIVKWVVEQLQTKGKVIRGWLGMSVQKVKINAEIKYDGLAVVSLVENSPAANAGIKVGDILLEVGNLPLHNPRHFSLAVAESKIGTEIPVILQRDGEEIKTSVIVSELSENKPDLNKPKYNTDAAESYGISDRMIEQAVNFSDLGIKAYYDENMQEFVITEVDIDSDAERKGIKTGDKIRNVDGRKIFGIEDFQVKIREAMQNKQIKLQLFSDDGFDTVILNLENKNEQN